MKCSVVMCCVVMCGVCVVYVDQIQWIMIYCSILKDILLLLHFIVLIYEIKRFYPIILATIDFPIQTSHPL